MIKLRLLLVLAGLAGVLSWLAYGTSLTVTLISEDWIHVYLAQEISQGQVQLLIDSFTRPWLQTSRVGIFYRPLIDLSFLFDVMLRQLVNNFSAEPGEAAFIFRLSNLNFHIVTSFCTGLITYCLVKLTGGRQATRSALFAGALFAVCPLAQETLLWITCRCDGLNTCLSSLCLTFYLFYRTRGGRLFRGAALLSYLLALGAKETSLTMPLVLLALEILLMQDKRVILRMKELAPFATLTILFLATRYLVLKGIGGYQTSLARLLNGSILDHIFTSTDWLRLAFPYNIAAFEQLTFLPLLYTTLYLLLATLLTLEAIKPSCGRPNSESAKLFSFLALASLFSFLPALQVFMILPTLFGSRTIYWPLCFAIMALSIFLAQRLKPGRATLFVVLLTAVWAFTANLNTLAFQSHSRAMMALRQGCRSYLSQTLPPAMLTILNIPFNYRCGAALADAWQTRLMIMGTVKDTAALTLDRVTAVTTSLSFHPHPEIFNPERTAAQLQLKGSKAAMVLPGRADAFQYLDPAIADSWSRPIDISLAGSCFANTEPGTWNLHLGEGLLQLPFQSTDFIEVSLVKDGSASAKPIVVEAYRRFAREALSPDRLTLVWHSDLSYLLYPCASLAAARPDGMSLVYRFPMADKFSFKCARTLKDLTLLNVPQSYKVENIRLQDGSTLMPSFQLQDADQAEEELRFGAVTTGGDKLIYSTDTRTMAGVEKLLVVLAEREAAFIHTAGTLMETAKEGDLWSSRDGSRRAIVKPGQVIIDPGTLKPGRYQVRIIALGKDNQPQGYCSFPHDFIYKPGGFSKGTESMPLRERLLYENRPDKP
ncbi:MAG: hypothetical protein IPK73_13385 [Candidatus Obscuribacter sp.]|nr:hypothetical protein [Candidatus Obscuribacter sp.]MBK9282022.1 hypothetical protein [Candidatus Obscuribacter sp.]